MKITKKELPLIMHGVLVVALFCLLFVSVAVLMNKSVAWFAQNRKVDANGASVSLKDLGITDKYYAKRYSAQTKTETDYTEITSWEHLFDNLMPGDTVSIKAEYQSAEDQPRNLNVFFKALDETPLIKTATVDGTEKTYYYYFGSQLKITTALTYEMQNGAENETTKTESALNLFLVTPPQDQVSYEAAAAPNEIALAVFENITSGTTYTLELTIEFVNLDVDQNDYQGFGAEGTPQNSDGTTPNCMWQLIGFVEE